MKKYIPLFASFLLFLTGYAQPEEVLKSLDQQLRTIKTDTGRIRVIGDAIFTLQAQNLHLADSLASVELEIGNRMSDPAAKAQVYNDVGIVRYRLGDFAQCGDYYRKALEIREHLKDEKGIGSVLIKLGALYHQQGNYDQALECYLRCTRIFEKLNESGHVAYCLNNISNVYMQMHNVAKARQYAYLSLAINVRNQDSGGIVNNYNIIANAMAQQSKTDSAIILFNLAYDIAARKHDEATKASILNNIGTVYEAKADTVTALKYFLQAYNNADALGIKNAVALYAKNIGNGYVTIGEYAKAEPYVTRAYNIAKERNQLSVLSDAAYVLSCIAAQKKDYAKAYQYQLEAMQNKDSVYNEVSSKQIAEMQTKYETEKKEQQLQIQQLQINKRNIILVVLSIVFMLSLLIGWLAYNRYKLKQKNLMAAEAMKQQELRAKSVLEAEEHERQRIGKDLHDGVGQILSAAKLNLSALQAKLAPVEQSEKDMMQNALDLLDESVKEVRTISHNMMPNMLIKSGLASAVRDFVNKMTTTDKLKIDLDLVGMNKRLDGTVETVLFRVFQEIVNNIIRHSEASRVTIQLLQHEREIVMMIEDNGKGFDVEKTMTGESGIGLKSITSRVEYLHGTLHIDSMPGRGTTVTIEIPHTP